LDEYCRGLLAIAVKVVVTGGLYAVIAKNKGNGVSADEIEEEEEPDLEDIQIF
jgi:PTS system fructose-specific IIC component